MFGADVGVLKRKMTRKKPDHTAVHIIEKPQQKNIVLSVNLMLFTGLLFLITVSRNIKVITAMLLPDCKKITIFKAIQQVFRIYQGRGHVAHELEFVDRYIPVHTILVDNEFQALREGTEELGVNVYVVTKDEHVSEGERQNKVIK